MTSALAMAPPSIDAWSSQGSLNQEAEAFVARALLMIGRARALVAADRTRAVGLLTARRAALGAHFQRYQKFKHGQIFDPVIQHGPPSSRVVAQTMKLDCLQLGQTFFAFHTRWLGCQTAEWNSYASDMLETTDMMIVNLNAELRAMRQLLMIADLYRR